MLRLKNTSIRQRLTLIIMGISCVTVLVTALTISIIGIYSLRGSIVSELDISATIVGDRNRATLAFDKKEQAESNLSILGVKPLIVQACLYDSTGNEFAAYINPKYRGETVCPKDLAARAKIAGERIELMKTIEGDFGVAGYIYLESTLEQLDEYVIAQFKITLTATVAALFLSFLLAWFALKLQQEYKKCCD